MHHSNARLLLVVLVAYSVWGTAHAPLTYSVLGVLLLFWFWWASSGMPVRRKVPVVCTLRRCSFSSRAWPAHLPLTLAWCVGHAQLQLATWDEPREGCIHAKISLDATKVPPLSALSTLEYLDVCTHDVKTGAGVH